MSGSWFAVADERLVVARSLYLLLEAREAGFAAHVLRRGSVLAMMVLRNRMFFAPVSCNISMARCGEAHGSGKHHLLVGIPKCALIPFVIKRLLPFSASRRT